MATLHDIPTPTVLLLGMTVVIRPPPEQTTAGEELAGGTQKMDKAVSKKLLLIAQFFGLQASWQRDYSCSRVLASWSWPVFTYR